jgi:hypothetical protein
MQEKGVFSYNYGKTRVVFARCIWIGGNFKIGEGLFFKHIFLTLTPVKNVFTRKFHLKCMIELCEFE